MSTAVDTNVLIALWKGEEPAAIQVENVLGRAALRGQLVICGAVYAELLAYPGRKRAFIDGFCAETGILVDWQIDEPIWVAAGTAFQDYADRRRKKKSGNPRRILADFLIGAHALERRHELLTLDGGIYRSAFPALKIVDLK